MERLNLANLADDLIDLFALKAQRKGLQLRIDAPLRLPVGVECDVARVRQVLVNLIGNAIKFTDMGSVTASISLEEPLSPGPLLRITVTDTGIGTITRFIFVPLLIDMQALDPM